MWISRCLWKAKPANLLPMLPVGRPSPRLFQLPFTFFKHSHRWQRVEMRTAGLLLLVGTKLYFIFLMRVTYRRNALFTVHRWLSLCSALETHCMHTERDCASHQLCVSGFFYEHLALRCVFCCSQDFPSTAKRSHGEMRSRIGCNLKTSSEEGWAPNFAGISTWSPASRALARRRRW